MFLLWKHYPRTSIYICPLYLAISGTWRDFHAGIVFYSLYFVRGFRGRDVYFGRLGDKPHGGSNLFSRLGVGYHAQVLPRAELPQDILRYFGHALIVRHRVFIDNCDSELQPSVTKYHGELITMELLKKKCVPCEGGTPPMTDEEEDKLKSQVPDWVLNRGATHKLEREFKFKNFKASLAFVNKVGALAESEGHHPDIHIYYSKVLLELYTHAVGGLSENDFILAAKINAMK